MFGVYKEICIYTQNMFTDYKKQMTSQEFAHEHVFKGLNDRLLFKKANTCVSKAFIRPFYTKSNRKAMNRNWSNQKAIPSLKTKTGNK